MARYSRRLQTINGSYGRVADERGQCALVARNRARDLAETDRPDWDTKVREALEMCLKNNSQLKVLDGASVETPHSYGPVAAFVARRKKTGTVRFGRMEIRSRLGKSPTVGVGK